MSEPKSPRPALLIWAVTYQPESADLKSLFEIATLQLGKIISASKSYLFDNYSTYYRSEMGAGLVKRLFAFEGIRDMGELVKIKRDSFALEQRFSINKKRVINIDPAMLSEGNFILSTFKYAAHRPYLGNGVYADITLIYKSGEYQPLEWTYPDYREDDIRRWLKEMRTLMLAFIRGVR